MTYQTMAAAFQDNDFMARVAACVQQEARSGANAATDYGIAVQNGLGRERDVLGWAVVVATDGTTTDAVTDAQILAAVQAAWPTTWPPPLGPPPVFAPLPKPPIMSANAGVPGSFRPTEAGVPAAFANLTDLTPIPSTAWVTGQSVTLGDGSSAHWDGTAWVVGVAP